MLLHHQTYNSLLFDDLKKINDQIQTTLGIKFMFKVAPVKGKARAMVKLKENILKNMTLYFPLDTLKDLSRGS